jgi:uncharacterized membrane protein YebE (DUF533 family)
MKNALTKKTLGVLALGLIATGAQANWDHHEHAYNRHAYQQSQRFSQMIDARQDRQMERIMDGMHEGRLTRGEFRRLKLEQRDIHAMEQHFRADGVIDAREFQRLDRALDLAGRNIQAEKHDRQARSTYGNHYRFN